MRLQKVISVLLHPIVIPTIGVLLYLLVIPHAIQRRQSNYLIGLVFFSTYLIPVVILMILKGLKMISSFELPSIKERKFPLFLMILLFIVLGNSFFKYTILRDFGFLFYATSFSLIVVYLFSFFNQKVSLHLLSMGSIVGFFMMMSIAYQISLLLLIALLMLLSGVLAASRLHLKAHTSLEVYLGFFLGLIAQIACYTVL